MVSEPSGVHWLCHDSVNMFCPAIEALLISHSCRYWNRYPGLMCDVEAYIYMPMLEEMDYMPKHKYASGEELRLYANSIVEKYGLENRAMFQSETKGMTWDLGKQVWHVEIDQTPQRGQTSRVSVTANFVMLASGVLNNAKLPNTLGGDSFRGDMFHTARWNYGVTGGSPAKPDLTKLKDKKVGIIGTGMCRTAFEEDHG